MPLDKRNSIMAVATGLISSLFNVASSGDVPFRQLHAAAPVLASWFYQSSLLFFFVLHFLLPYRIGDDLQYARYGFGVRLR